jgi:hypothetical protein
MHLIGGLSRATITKIMKVLETILLMAINLGCLLTQAESASVSESQAIHNSIPRIPYDVRTAISKLSIEPKITRSICCPKCFAKYSLNSLPQICGRRESPQSKPCGETLWTTRSTQGGPRLVPKRLYSTQDFESWLEFFLSRPGIEDLIDKSYMHQPSSGVMHSIWDSPAWQSLGPFTTTPGNLTFSYYIDWFNPLTNKIAGKSVSCGAIIFFCLNLPYELQHLTENTFFAGITPGPREPTVTTITAVSDPIVDRFEVMWHGKTIKTHHYPGGTWKRAAILPAIGDLLAIRKALGFAGVRSHHFCSFCDLHQANIDNLDSTSWKLRQGAKVFEAAKQWHEAVTKAQRKELFSKHGIRWSSLYRLPYRDPVLHIVLGIMHNWMEGILQLQTRIKWGIGNESSAIKLNTSKDGDSALPISDNNISEIDVDMLDDEINNLHEESQKFKDKPMHLKRHHSEISISQSDSTYNSAEDEDFQPDSDSDSNSGSDDENINMGYGTASKANCIFDAASLSKIRACISDTVIPSWIERPPTNLGEKSHGKLKANHWMTLFTIFFPLILPEIWHSSKNTCYAALLENFYDLVTCTNIVCSYSTSAVDADKFLDHYIKYRMSSKVLFPNVNTRPNCHYAMHIPELLKFWGPLIKLSEFAYEQHNGTLQKIKTNGHICKLFYITCSNSIIDKFCKYCIIRGIRLYNVTSNLSTWPSSCSYSGCNYFGQFIKQVITSPHSTDLD